ncbi:hypothetical protein FLX08_15265 [Microbispora hainanensis]|uniref:Uncharacterized protein n=1 Tax=Microbispora hainanensis TaxID=568844 RepID=A0A544YUT6_9ACTN|nr:hypothetical protein FLX08_15265 [Microbispora hainanensis]
MNRPHEPAALNRPPAPPRPPTHPPAPPRPASAQVPRRAAQGPPGAWPGGGNGRGREGAGQASRSSATARSTVAIFLACAASGCLPR